MTKAKTIDERLADARIDFDALDQMGQDAKSKRWHFYCPNCWPNVKPGDWYVSICGTPQKARKRLRIPALLLLCLPGRCKKCTFAKMMEHAKMHNEKPDWGKFE